MDQTVLFGRYRLVEPAGTGGTAEVWRAVDERTGDEVAVKRLHPLVLASEVGRQRLVREFEAVRGLRHPSVVRVRDLEMSDDEAVLVLDFVPGTSLRDRLASGDRPTPPEASRIVADLAGALGAAHAAGIVHRDVSPGNVLLGPDGRARLTDFGIAWEPGDDAAAVTQTGTIVGTLRYMSPEQLRGRPATPRSDLYGLAAVAYEMLAGRPPYPATNPVELVEAQRAGAPPIAGVPPAVDAAVRRGLAPDPLDRPPSVEAFSAHMAAAVAGAGAAVEPGLLDLAPASRGAVPVAVGAALALGILIFAASAMGGPSEGDVAAGAESASPRPTVTAEPTPKPTETPRPRDNDEDGDD